MKWIKIEDGLPADPYTQVLAFDGDDWEQATCSRNGTWEDSHGDEILGVTHWTIPTLPDGKDVVSLRRHRIANTPGAALVVLPERGYKWESRMSCFINQGASDKLNHLTLTMNPYEPGTERHEAWALGWGRA